MANVDDEGERMSEKSFIDEWHAWMRENYMWVLPIVASFSAPIIGSWMNIVYDYLKEKKLLP